MVYDRSKEMHEAEKSQTEELMMMYEDLRRRLNDDSDDEDIGIGEMTLAGRTRWRIVTARLLALKEVLTRLVHARSYTQSMQGSNLFPGIISMVRAHKAVQGFRVVGIFFVACLS